MPVRDEVGRREFNKTTAAAVIGALTGTIGTGAGAASYLSKDDEEPQDLESNKPVRNSYDAEELEGLRSCLDDEELKGLDESLDELLDPETGRDVIEAEFVYDPSGGPRDVGSSFRYKIELENSDETHTLGWYSASNEVIEPFAEAKNYDGALENYAEENCS